MNAVFTCKVGVAFLGALILAVPALAEDAYTKIDVTNKVGVMYEVDRLVAAYSDRGDAKDAKGLADIFTEDACWAGYWASGKEVIKGCGNEELLKTFGLFFKGSQGYQTNHFQAFSMLEEVKPEYIKIKTPVLITWTKIEEPNQGEIKIRGTGYYNSVIVKTRDGFKFKERMLHFDTNK